MNESLKRSTEPNKKQPDLFSRVLSYMDPSDMFRWMNAQLKGGYSSYSGGGTRARKGMFAKAVQKRRRLRDIAHASRKANQLRRKAA